jgi:hypothetical protein
MALWRRITGHRPSRLPGAGLRSGRYGSSPRSGVLGTALLERAAKCRASSPTARAERAGALGATGAHPADATRSCARSSTRPRGASGPAAHGPGRRRGNSPPRRRRCRGRWRSRYTAPATSSGRDVCPARLRIGSAAARGQRADSGGSLSRGAPTGRISLNTRGARRIHLRTRRCSTTPPFCMSWTLGTVCPDHRSVPTNCGSSDLR